MELILQNYSICINISIVVLWPHKNLIPIHNQTKKKTNPIFIQSRNQIAVTYNSYIKARNHNQIAVTMHSYIKAPRNHNTMNVSRKTLSHWKDSSQLLLHLYANRWAWCPLIYGAHKRSGHTENKLS